MIALDNFESCVPYRILVRGEEYYETGAVSELEEDSPGEWTATVEGTENYNVEISMDGKEIKSWYCDSAYDGGKGESQCLFQDESRGRGSRCFRGDERSGQGLSALCGHRTIIVIR